MRDILIAIAAALLMSLECAEPLTEYGETIPTTCAQCATDAECESLCGY